MNPVHVHDLHPQIKAFIKFTLIEFAYKPIAFARHAHTHIQGVMYSAPPYTVISAHNLESEYRSHFFPNQPARVGIINQRIPRKKKKARNSFH